MPRHFTLDIEQVELPCLGAQQILSKAYDACESFHVIFRQLQESAGHGVTTDSQEDTLRAMLVFACAGLDSAVKLLVRDALHSVIDSDSGAQANFTESVRRRLPDMDSSRDLLASVLTAPNPRVKLIERWTGDLLADSLQSVEQLSKVAAAFNTDVSGLFDMAQLREAFRVRNQIVHEMDIDHAAEPRTFPALPRRPRRREDMERLTAVVLGTGATFLQKVHEKLNIKYTWVD
jgi:hypothetical protein